MLSQWEFVRTKWVLLLVCGLWNSFDQWTRILLPFAQWQLKPQQQSLYASLLLNCIGNSATFVGSFFVAKMIDSFGGRWTALVCTLVVSLYQAGYSWIHDFYLFAALQLLLLFNHVPTVLDALMARLGNQMGDQKLKVQLLMQLSIPASIAFAAGPFMAVQLIYLMFSPRIQIVQSLSGLFLALTVFPLVFFLFPHDKANDGMGDDYSFGRIARESNNPWTLLFIMLISGPFNCYDQIMRLRLTGHMLSDPTAVAFLALVLGSSAFLANVFFLPFLQRRLKSQRIVQLAVGLMCLSYLYLVHVVQFNHVLLGMPVQVVGVSLALGQLTAQLMSSVPRSHIGKAAALNRLAQIGATIMAPLLVGQYTEHDEVALLCYFSAALCLCAIVLIEFFGGFMGKMPLIYELPMSRRSAE